MSAENGYAKAQFRLGMKLLRGYGVEKDMDKGINWIRQAAINGNENAINFMDKYIDIENEK